MQQEALAALDALPADLISRINAASVAADEDEDTVSYEDIGPLPSARPPPPRRPAPGSAAPLPDVRLSAPAGLAGGGICAVARISFESRIPSVTSWHSNDLRFPTESVDTSSLSRV